MCIYIYTYICIYTYTHTHTHTYSTFHLYFFVAGSTTKLVSTNSRVSALGMTSFSAARASAGLVSACRSLSVRCRSLLVRDWALLKAYRAPLKKYRALLARNKGCPRVGWARERFYILTRKYFSLKEPYMYRQNPVCICSFYAPVCICSLMRCV